MKILREHFKKCGIYMIINTIDDKVYIGKSVDIYSRIHSHVRSLRKKDKRQDNDHFINAWHKHGEENFKYEVLEYFEVVNEELLKEKELYWIDFYQSTDRNKGYNLRRDSSTKMILHEETLEKYKKRKGSLNPNYGNNWSNDKKQMMSELKKRQYQSGECKINKEALSRGNKTRLEKLTDPEYNQKFRENVSKAKIKFKIEQYSKQGELIKTWENVKEILKENPNYKWQQIYSVCSGYKPSMYGFIWKKISNNDIVHP